MRFGFLAIVILLLPCFTDAHELLPRNVVDFIATHPEASSQELQHFIRTNAPSLAKDLQSNEDIAALLGTHQTSFWDNALDFFKLGIEHILSGPDHILFVLSLLLVVTSVKEILQLTSTFTIAHTITLLLAGFGLVTLSPHIVEPLIAFSISYVALTTIFFTHWLHRRNIRDTIGTVFFFGLFHGLGFAGLLRDIRLPSDRFLSSLIAFNLGIEGGQILIVASVLPFLLYYRNKWWYPRLVTTIAIVIAGIGMVWGVQRIARAYSP